MSTTPKLGSTIYIEVAGDQAAPVLMAESPLPLDWQHAFSTSREDQSVLDVHLLFGSSYKASENQTVGRWRISGIPPAERGKLHVRLKVHVNTQGGIDVTAELEDKPLSVFRLPGGSIQVPLVRGEAGTKPVEIPERKSLAGDQEPLGDDNLPVELLKAGASEASAKDTKVAQQCEGCGGLMEVRFVGEMRDKRLVCVYCGAEADLPDTYQRVTRKRERKDRLWGNDTTETVHIETRRDNLSGERPLEPIPEIDDLRDLIERGGFEGIDENTLEILKKRGFNVSFGGKSSIVSVIRRLDKQDEDRKNERPRGYIPLTPQEIIELAGEPLPPEERRNCPECDAVISRRTRKCPWCSVSLTDYEDR